MAAPGRETFGRTPERPTLREAEYVARLRSSQAPSNCRYVQAFDFASEALRLAPASPGEAAQLMGNAFLCSDRGATAGALVYRDAHGAKALFSVMHGLAKTQAALSLHSCVLTWAVFRMVQEPPNTMISLLEGALNTTARLRDDNIMNREGKASTAALLVFKSVEYTRLGRSKYAYKCLAKAAKVDSGNPCGDGALLLLLTSPLFRRCAGVATPKTLDELAQNVRDLRGIRERMHPDDRDYPDTGLRLSNLLVAAGPGQSREEGMALRAGYQAERARVLELHGDHAYASETNPDTNEALRVSGILQRDLPSREMFPGAVAAVAAGAPLPASHPHDGAQTASDDAAQTDICMVCGASALDKPGKVKLQKCGRCKMVSYCSQECQRTHWPAHKKVCKKLAKIRARGVANTLPKRSAKQPKPKPVPAGASLEEHRAAAAATLGRGAAAAAALAGAAHGTGEDTFPFVTLQKWIAATLADEQFVAWWSQGTRAQQKKRLMFFMPDMSLKGRREKQDGLFPKLAVDVLSGTGLLDKMREMSLKPVDEMFEEDLVVAGRSSAAGKLKFGPSQETCLATRMQRGRKPSFAQIPHPGVLRGAPGPDGRTMLDLVGDPNMTDLVWKHVYTAGTTRRMVWFGVVMGVIDLFREQVKREDTPNLVMRAQGCSVCQRELPLDGISERLRCSVCMGTHWCGDRCRGRQSPPHLSVCPGTPVISRALRSTMADKQNTGGRS